MVGVNDFIWNLRLHLWQLMLVWMLQGCQVVSTFHPLQCDLTPVFEAQYEHLLLVSRSEEILVNLDDNWFKRSSTTVARSVDEGSEASHIVNPASQAQVDTNQSHTVERSAVSESLLMLRSAISRRVVGRAFCAVLETNTTTVNLLRESQSRR